MIARVNTPARRARFRNACRGRWVLDALLPLDQQIFGKSQPGRFYAGPTLALELSGRTAWAAGHANPEELASFLAFCGCGSVILDEGICSPPTGWHRAETLTVFGLAPGKVLPLPAVEDALWSSLTLDAQPPAMTVAQALYPTDPARRDDAYSELCSKRSRGRAVVWALQQGGQTVCTVGAYAVANGQAYMACGQTAEPLRGKGIGGRLIVQMANALAAEGEHPVFLCAPERVHFYTRLALQSWGSMYVLPRREPDDLNALRFTLGIFRGRTILYWRLSRPAGRSKRPSCPLAQRSVHASENTRTLN